MIHFECPYWGGCWVYYILAGILIIMLIVYAGRILIKEINKKRKNNTFPK